MRKKKISVVLVFLVAAVWSFGQTVLPHEFEDGQTAVADEMNANFQTIAEAVDAVPVFSGLAPIDVDEVAQTIGLNPATTARDVMTWDGSNWVAQPDGDDLVDKNNVQPYLAIRFVIAVQGVFPSRSAEPFLGQIMMFASDFAPRGFLFCDGQMLLISQNQSLYSLLGTTYGGDGRVTFALPDLRGRVPIHAGSGDGLTYRFLGAKSGAVQTAR